MPLLQNISKNETKKCQELYINSIIVRKIEKVELGKGFKVDKFY